MLFPRPYGGAYSRSPIPQLEQDVGMGHFPPPPPPPPHKLEILDPSLKLNYTLLSGSAEQDALTMKESPLKNVIPSFLRPHPSWGWLQMTNSFCCLYLLFSVSVPAPSSFIKMLDPCTHSVHVLHVCPCLLILHTVYVIQWLSTGQHHHPVYR